MIKNFNGFGLIINSDIELEELPLTEEECDLRIVVDKTNNDQACSSHDSFHFEMSKDRFLINIPNVAMFHGFDGNLIIIRPYDGSNNKTIKLFLLGSCIGAILQQRGIIPIHGSALFYKNKGILIIGESGAGKSTLSSGLIRHGAKMLSDDMVATKIVDKDYYCNPSIPEQKLSYESLEVNGIAFDNNDMVPYTVANRKKYYVNRTDVFYDKPLKIDIIFNIKLSGKSEIHLQEMNGIKKLETIIKNIYRLEFIEGFGLKDDVFKVSAAIANQSRVYTIERPLNGLTVNEQIMAIDELLENINKVVC